MRIRFSNPWWVVVGAVTGLFVCNGPVLAFTFGVFLKPIMADMGWQRGTASFALSVGGVVSALMVPVIGWMMDRWSIRRIALPWLVVYALAMGLLGLSPHSLLIFTLLFAFADGASAIQSPIGYAKAIAAWFDRRRGLALGIAMSGVGLGGFVMPQLAEWLIERGGWRGAYPLLGLLTLVIAFPAVALWIREPRPGESEQDGPVISVYARALWIREPRSGEGEHHGRDWAANLSGLSVRQAASVSRFWMLLAVFFLVAIALNGTVAHVVPLLTDAGLTPAKAAATMGIFGLATMVGRLLAGYLIDRFFAAHVATVLFLAPIAGFALLASAAGVLPALGVTLVGLGLGTEIDLIAFLTSRYLGQRAFGQIYGYCFMVFGLGSSFGRFIGGYVYDLAGSYNPALIGAAIALVIAVILVNRLGPYLYPVLPRELAEMAQPAVP